LKQFSKLFTMPTAPDSHDAHDYAVAHPRAARPSPYQLHLTQNPIFRFGPAFSPECSALAFLAFAISASIIACVTNQRSGFGSVLPA
jgi:hypothetical protein